MTTASWVSPWWVGKPARSSPSCKPRSSPGCPTPPCATPSLPTRRWPRALAPCSRGYRRLQAFDHFHAPACLLAFCLLSSPRTGELKMQRRTFLAGTAAATALARPALAQAASKTLRYVPQADLTVLDPVMTTAYITRYHATMVWDQLYGLDSNLQPQPQMVAGHTLEDDGRLWTFTLRDNLRFTDGEPVRGRDCIASIKRWAARDPMGQALLARLAEMTAPDDRRFVIRLTRPFSLVLNCLAKIGPPALLVMPERLATTDPFQSIKEVVGSGPFRFEAAERVVGSRVAYSRNAGYVPRPNGATDWLAGPKIVNFDRVE